MRKITCFLLFLAFIMAGTMTAHAVDFIVDDICYNVIDGDEVEVAKPDSVLYQGEVFIPATVTHDNTTYRVTRIGRSAFSSCKELTLVDIPEGVTTIAYSAFSGCSQLENIDLPNSLITIEGYAFTGCSSFTTFHIPRNVANIDFVSFRGCANLTFFTCSSLNSHFKAVDGVLYSKDLKTLYFYPRAAPATSFEIPSTTTSLYDYSFSFNNNLEHVTIPESVTWLGMNIFRDCKRMVSVDVPDGITHMGVTVFGGCSNLESVHLPASLDSLMNCTIMDCDKLTEITVPRNVSYIDEQGLAFAPNLKTVTFEEGSRLKFIGRNAFMDCVSLESLDMPNTVTSLGTQSFHNCQSLRSVHLSDSLTELGTAVFVYCQPLVEVKIPGGVPSIHNVLLDCPSLKRVMIGDRYSTPGTTLIKNVGVGGCEQIQYLELGANIDSLEHIALADLQNLKVLISWATTPPRCHDYWHCFYPAPQNLDAVLYVPKASLEAYKTANEWKNFKVILAIEDVGDLNGSGSITISDVTTLIEMLLNGQTEYPTYAIADVNLDGVISIKDVTDLIARMLSGD